MVTANERIIQMVQSGQITPQQADQFFSNAGVNVASGGGARTRYLQENPQVNAQLTNMLSAFGGAGQGAMPVGIEPLHRGEKQGYSTMLDPGLLGGGGMVEGQQRIRDFLANPQSASAAYMSPEAKQAMQQALGMYGKADSTLQSMLPQSMAMYGKADTALQQGTAAITGADFERYQNPLQSQVIDMALSRLSDEYAKEQDARMAELNRRPSASFGDQFGATRMAELAKENFRTRAEIPVNVGYRGWQDALEAIQGERNRSLQAGSTYGGLGGGIGSLATQASSIYSGLGGGLGNLAATGQTIQQGAMNSALAPIDALYKTGQIGTEVGYGAADRRIAAGQNIRGYNQALSDITMNDYMAERAFPRENLTQTMGIVPSFATQNYSVSGGGQVQTTPSTAAGIGGVLQAIGGTEGINNTKVGRWFSGL